MSSAYLDHPIRELLGRTLELENNPELASADITANAAIGFSRDKTIAALKLLRSNLETTPALYVSIPGLNQIQNIVQAIHNEISAFIINKNAGHITNAAAQVESHLFPLMWAFGGHPRETKISDTAAANAIETLTGAAEIGFSQLISKRDELAAQIETLKQIIADQNLKLEGMLTTIATQKADATSTVASLKNDYTEDENLRNKFFGEAVEKMKESFNQIRTTTSENAEALIASLEQSRRDAAQIVQVVGNIGVTGNYQKIANNEDKSANLWRNVTLSIFGVGILLALATFAKFYFAPFSTETAFSVVIRLLFAIAITAPAWYTAKESARHRSTSDRARQTELELASLGPFIELLPGSKKESIREELTKKYFGRDIESHEAEPPIDLKDIKEFVVEVAKAVRK